MVNGTTAERGHAELLRRIGTAGARWRSRSAAAGACRALALVVPVLAAELVVDGAVFLPAWARVAWLAAAAALALAALVAFVARPLLSRVDAVAVAARIEADHPELGELLESATELWEKRGAPKLGYSVGLIDALIEKAMGASTGLDLSRTGGDVGLRRWGRALGAAAAASAVALALAGGARLGPALERLGRPLSEDGAPRVAIEVEPGDARVVSGDDLEVAARVRWPRGVAPGRGRPAATPVDSLGRAAPTLIVERDGEARVERPMSPSGGGARRAVIGAVRAPLRYAVAAGGATSRWYSVEVIDRPFVAGIRLEYEFPAYSGLLPRTVDENTGDITALAGTRVTVTVTPSKPLESAALVFATGERHVLERSPNGGWRTTLTVAENASYGIDLLDRDGLSNPDSASWSVVAVRDEQPLVRIVRPGADVSAPADMVLPVAVSAVDDYGVSRLVLRYAVDGTAEEGALPLAAPAGRREVSAEASWDLRETGAVPGSTIVYFAEVTDNDAVAGPKTARSESYVVRVPSIAEMYTRVAEQQDDIADDLEDLLAEQEEVRDEFEELRDELKSDPAMDWQEEERVEAAVERQEKLADEVVETAYRLDDLAADMSESDRVTLESLEKTQEIARLLDEVATDEMRELLDSIRQAMNDIRPEQLAAAMEQMSFTQDDYLRRLEQTLNLLRRVKAEQELADVANRAEDLAAREERVAEEAAARKDGERSDDLAAQQAGLKQEAEALLADLAKAADDMAMVDEQTAAEMRAAAEEMQEAGTLAKMEQGRSKLAESKPSEAAEACQSASSDLKSLFTRTSACRGGAACSVQKRDREATLRAVDELLGVSAEQERILGAVETRERIPRPEIVELVAKQADLVASLEDVARRLFTVSKDSFVIDPVVYRMIGVVQATMTRAAAEIASGGSRPGRKQAREALGSVNALVVNLLTSSQNSSASSGGSALEQLMQQLQSMAERQQALNDMMQGLQQRSEQMGMGPQMSRQLAEMKAAQERLADEARRLAKEFGDRREVLGRLDDMASDMEEALAEMERSGASQETVDRQKRILSRLLDAQRSLRRRDYMRERLSRPGEEVVREGPGALPEGVTRATEELREDLLRAMERSYPAEYRDLIRAYFDGLARDAGGGAAGR